MGLQGLLGSILAIIGSLPAFVIGVVIFLFTLFYLLRDGDKFIAWLRNATPLEPQVMNELMERIDDLLWAAIIGNVIVAGVQAILTVVAFFFLGFDDIVFWERAHVRSVVAPRDRSINNLIQP